MREGSTGVHISHCCLQHGCKYGDKDCPVASGGYKQEYPCETCGMESSGERVVLLDENGLKHLKEISELTGEKFLGVQLNKTVEFHLKNLKSSKSTKDDAAMIAAGFILLGISGLYKMSIQAIHESSRKFMKRFSISS